MGPLSPNINNREADKFDLNSLGETAVRTISEITNGDINIKAPTGPFEITVATVTSVAASPLASPLTNRVSISIRNKSSNTTIYFGKATVTADDASTGGWEIGPQEDFNIDLDDTQTFYLVTPALSTADVKILEIAST